MSCSDGPDISNKKNSWFAQIVQAVLEKHKYHHTIDRKTGIKVSFGVVRIANIEPCIQLARYLLSYIFPENTEVRVMAYHSRQVLLLRHEQEKHLDKVLKRKEGQGEQPDAFYEDNVRKHLDTIANQQPGVSNLLFILVATPIEEVGRDHDFDWAIIEPSSYRSIIQLAGRVRRHRGGEINKYNVGILQYNWRTLKDGDKPRKPRFYRPGYEISGNLSKGKKPGSMESHDLFRVVDTSLIGMRLDAIPRIQERQEKSKTPMALLEHAVIDSQLTYYDGAGPETLQGYIQWYWYLTALPQKYNRFRQNTKKTIQLYRVTDGSEFWFTERDSKGKFIYTNDNKFSKQDDAYQISTVFLTDNQYKRLWLQRDYLHSLKIQQESYGISLKDVVKRYGEISLDVYRDVIYKSYEYNDQLGLYEQENNRV